MFFNKVCGFRRHNRENRCKRKYSNLPEINIMHTWNLHSSPIEARPPRLSSDPRYYNILNFSLRNIEYMKIHACNYIFHFWKITFFPYPFLAAISFLFGPGKVIHMNCLNFLFYFLSFHIQSAFIFPEFNSGCSY